MKKHNSFDKDSTKGHAFFLYSNTDERLELIAEYFKQGLAKNELCVFVTPETQIEVIENFKTIGFDISQAVKDGGLRIFEMNTTYLPNGRFVADYMLSNVSTFIEESKMKGFSGLRTAGEMSWLDDNPEFVHEAVHYEHSVNNLNDPEPSFVGLCLYPMQNCFNSVLQGAIQSHPSFIYDGQVQSNPHFGDSTLVA